MLTSINKDVAVETPVKNKIPIAWCWRQWWSLVQGIVSARRVPRTKLRSQCPKYISDYQRLHHRLGISVK